MVEQRGGDQTEVDWTKLSPQARHRDRPRTSGSEGVPAASSPDCIDLGEEVAAEVEALGAPLEAGPAQLVRGEPAPRQHTTSSTGRPDSCLDKRRPKVDTEPLADRLWRRYGRRAFSMLEEIRADPSMAEDVMGSADCIRVELHSAARSEMVTRLEDFMRRRSKIDLVVHDAERRLGRPGRRRGIPFGRDAEDGTSRSILRRGRAQYPTSSAALEGPPPIDGSHRR